ncbi:MAG: DALR anticodon-binding domain-containing protein, partial [Nitrospirota bacterium]|nr:DALR anticodon-binding domain-containing protein [Nitrospirota bacterium]
LAALERFRGEEGSAVFITAIKRVNNIISKGADFEVDEALFREDAEKTLWREFRRVSKETEGLAPFEAIRKLGELVGPINGFFDGVLVMDKDEQVKNNRLGMLKAISGAVAGLADFSKLVE